MTSDLAKYIDKFSRSKNVGDVKVFISSSRNDFHYASAASKPKHYLASSSKLYTNSLIFGMIDSQAFDLSTPVVEILGQELLEGLTTGNSHKEVTIEQLMRHTSGIPDFFEEKTPDGKAILDLVLKQDQGFTTLEMINRAKAIRSKGLPGKRAHYSDTNYQLLCLILEKVSGESYERIFQDRICKPLGLVDTYVDDISRSKDSVSKFKYGMNEISIPNYMASTRADGGVVSNCTETMKFLKAYYRGELFNRRFSDPNSDTWRKIFSPFEYGLGQMKLALPSYMTGFKRTAALFGHGGATGHAMFVDLKNQTYFVAVVNQLKNRSLVYRLLINLQLRSNRG